MGSPQGLASEEVKHFALRVVERIAPAQPQPDSPSFELIEEGPEAAGDYVVFKNPNVWPSGANRSNIGEPSVALGDTNNLFYTGNWHAARSTDAGASWSHVNPSTRFSSAWGGFCCDQRVVTTGGLAVWLLQYSSDGSGNGGIRLTSGSWAWTTAAGSTTTSS